MNQIEFDMIFSQIINDLFHADLANLTKAASHKARSCRLRRVFTYRMASTSAASALREIREICVRIKCLCGKEQLNSNFQKSSLYYFIMRFPCCAETGETQCRIEESDGAYYAFNKHCVADTG